MANRHKNRADRCRHAILTFVAWSLIGCGGVPDQDLRPFTTDACSGFPEGTRTQPTLWLHCCTAHDLAYWQGGTRDERRAADYALRECVRDTGEAAIANVMLAGVWFGGTPYLPTSFRWGYGWPYLRGYEPLARPERAAVDELLRRFRDYE